jgi:hypothetical protein
MGGKPMIYSKTELGQTALQNRALGMTPRQRSAFIMFDGKRSLDEVLKVTASLGVTPEDVSHLLTLGLLAPQAGIPSAAPVVTVPLVAPVGAAPQAAAELSHRPDGLPTLSAQAHYLKAYPIATRLTADLGLRGFRLNLAVEAAGDLDKLKQLAPKIRDAVGPEKFLELENALYY